MCSGSRASVPAKVARQRADGLAGHVVQEVEADVGEARAARRADGVRDVRGRVAATQALQLVRGEALRAYAQPVHACRAEPGEVAALAAAGVGFNRYLRVGFQAERGVDGGEQPLNLGGAHQRRCAAAQVDAGQVAARTQRAVRCPSP